jgi:DNA-binding response OmpR family regulator
MSKGDIFLVDDNPNNLTLLYGILRKAGYQVRAANNGRRALETVAAYPPELVMLDINMPDMNGYEVCERLKASEATRDIPVIFISALDDVFDKVRAFEVGGVDYVPKPFHAEEVLARVETQINLFRLRRDLESKRLELDKKRLELEASNRELERQNDELARKNDELVRAQARTNLVFSALSDVLPGTVLDEKYQLDRKIGAGGFGAVFKATHIPLNRPVAIKVLRPSPGNDSPEALERFRQEALSASRLSHPNAVTVMDFGVSSAGIAYLVMELLEGRTLKDVLQEQSVLPLARCAEIVVPVCEALAEAHAASIVHRDVKPDNIFLHVADSREVIKVVDFGIAKLFAHAEAPEHQGMTETGVILGTPDYMAPERLSGGSYDGRSDVYSVGVLLFQMLSGEMPFKLDREAGPYAIALKLMTEEPRSLGDFLPDVDPRIDELVARALAKNPDLRPTASELGEAIRAAT